MQFSAVYPEDYSAHHSDSLSAWLVMNGARLLRGQTAILSFCGDRKKWGLGHFGYQSCFLHLKVLKCKL